MIKIYNEDCRKTMMRFEDHSIDVVMTSPFYNTNKKAGKKGTLLNTHPKDPKHQYVRYDVFVDNYTEEQYKEFTAFMFEEFDRVLNKNGVVLWNISYGAEGGQVLIDLMSYLSAHSNFMISDIIIWKKPSAIPNNMSANKLTRVCEFVFVLCRKSEFMTYKANKEVVSLRPDNQQKLYSPIWNFVEAKNNDGANPYNKATYSTELVEKLLSIYAQNGMIIYDPFMGTGTTAVACKKLNLNCYGSEISEAQCKYAEERLNG